MMYPVIGAYRLGDKVRIEVDGVLREGEIICIGLNGYVVAADACVFVVNDPQIKWCARTSSENEPKEENVIRYDSDTALGLATLNKAFELQKKYTELEGEIKRLYELVNDAMNGLHPLRLAFDNSFLGSIACMVCNDFRPLTDEEKAQFLIDIKNMANNLKKQSE